MVASCEFETYSGMSYLKYTQFYIITYIYVSLSKNYFWMLYFDLLSICDFIIRNLGQKCRQQQCFQENETKLETCIFKRMESAQLTAAKYMEFLLTAKTIDFNFSDNSQNFQIDSPSVA